MPTLALVRRSPWRAAPFVAAFAFSAWSFFTPGGDLPTGVAIWDKLGHALIFAAMTLTGAYAGARGRRLGWGLFGYGVLVELLQWTLPIQRDGDWHDVLADTIGIGAGLVVVTILRRRRRSRWRLRRWPTLRRRRPLRRWRLPSGR